MQQPACPGAQDSKGYGDMELKRSNPKAFQTLDLALKSLARIEGKTGWFESSKYEDGTPVAYVMALNELGHGPTPARPTMRPTAIQKENEWRDVAAQASRAVVNGKMTAVDAMEALTIKAEGDISKAIAQLTSPALSPITIELRAMKKRNPNLRVTAATVGIAARRVREPGYMPPSGVSDKPLIDSGLAIATLTHVVETSAA